MSSPGQLGRLAGLPTRGRRCTARGPYHAARFNHSRNARSTDVTEAEIEAKVFDIVADKLTVDRSEITRESNFTNDLNADSLDKVELVMEFEDQFSDQKLQIPDTVAEKIQTVGHAIEHIKEQLGSKQAS